MRLHLIIHLLVFQLSTVMASDDLATVTGGLKLGDSLASAIHRKPQLITLLGDKPNTEIDQTTLFEQIGPNDYGVNAVTYMFKKRHLTSFILSHPVTNERQALEAYGKLCGLVNTTGAGLVERAVDAQFITVCFKQKIGEAWITIPWSFGATTMNVTLQILHNNEVSHARKVVRDHLLQKAKDLDQQAVIFVSKLSQAHNTKIQFSPQIDSNSKQLSEYRHSPDKTRSTALGSAIAMHVGTLAMVGGFLFLIMIGAAWLLFKGR